MYVCIYFTYVLYTLLTVEKNKVVLCRYCPTIAFKMVLLENYFKSLDVLQEYLTKMRDSCESKLLLSSLFFKHYYSCSQINGNMMLS